MAKARLAARRAAARNPGDGPIYADVSTARGTSARPDADPRPVPTETISDAEVERAIRRGIDVLADQFDNGDGRLRGGQIGGVDALCAFALVAAGAAVDDPRLKISHPFINRVLDGIKAWPAGRTYGTGIRAAALAAARRPADQAFLAEDVRRLTVGHAAGRYGYRLGDSLYGDNSNSQFGVLGVWCGAEAGVDVPPTYWRTISDYWAQCQARDGAWNYVLVAGGDRFGRLVNEGLRPVTGTTALGAAGTASMLVAGEHVEAYDRGFRVGRPAYPPAIAHGIDYFETKEYAYDADQFADFWGYTLFSVERVGLASGLKYFGGRDWFRMFARHVVDRQRADGSWGDLIDTPFALLFLARGRLPNLMNKVRLDAPPPGQASSRDLATSSWNNRPHDIDFLARHASGQIEKALNWQVVPVGRAAEDWMDAPILYFGSHQNLSFTDADVAKLRRYVEAGGTIFTNADKDNTYAGSAGLAALAAGAGGGRPTTLSASAFDRCVAELAARLFPRYPYQDVPSGHPIYSSLYKLKPEPPLKGVSNGGRLLLVHTQRDLATLWQARAVDEPRAGRPAYQFGVNLMVYAAGRRQEVYRHRLESMFVPERTTPPAARVVVAPVRYDGNWEPEPGAWTRFGRMVGWKTNVLVEVRPTDAGRLAPGSAAVAHLTGTAAWNPTAAHVAMLHSFVRSGGVLLVDDCGGSGAFARSVEAALRASFVPVAAWRTVGPAHPMLKGGEPGMADGLRLQVRRYAAEKRVAPEDAAVRVARVEAGAVVLTRADLVSGLLDLRTWGIVGYEPESCDGLVRNLIFWAMDGRPERAVAATGPAATVPAGEPAVDPSTEVVPRPPGDQPATAKPKARDPG